jgi:hypothetical protein
MDNDTIYVCEWATNYQDNTLDDIQLLSIFDFTYHHELNPLFSLTLLGKEGYIISKSLDPQNEYIPSLSNSLQCNSIWIYQNNEVIGKYDLDAKNWIHTIRQPSWNDEWIDMLYLPAPLKKF